MAAIADQPFCSAPQCCEPAPVIDKKGRSWCSRHMPETPEQRDERHRGYLQLSLSEWRRRAQEAEVLVGQLQAENTRLRKAVVGTCGDCYREYVVTYADGNLVCVDRGDCQAAQERIEGDR